MLSAVVHRRERQGGAGLPPPPLHVLDLMAGSGVRSMRYLLQAGADHGALVAVLGQEPEEGR